MNAYKPGMMPRKPSVLRLPAHQWRLCYTNAGAERQRLVEDIRRLAPAVLVAGMFCFPTAWASQECDDGGPPPDAQFRDYTTRATPVSHAQHSLEEMIEFVATHFSASLAADMEADMTGPGACVRVVELLNKDGQADATTIGVRTRGLPLWYSAWILTHEYMHWTRARVASRTSGDPGQGDPETSYDDPCGRCRHAAMGAVDLGRLHLLCGDMTGEELEFLCKVEKHGRKETGKLLTSCLYAGCPSCCGYSYVPNVDELVPPLPCCD